MKKKHIKNGEVDKSSSHMLYKRCGKKTCIWVNMKAGE